MAFPFTPSHVDLGPATGPRLAMAWHMAEGGGTVGFLAKANPHGSAGEPSTATVSFAATPFGPLDAALSAFVATGAP